MRMSEAHSHPHIENSRSSVQRRRLSVNNITTILLLSLVVVAHAQAREPPVITLSCDGTVKTNVGNNEGQRKAINKVGVVVDLAEQTVSFAGYVAHIENVDAAAVFFGGGEDHAMGDIDRASGVMSATTVKGNLAASYELFCKPVTRSASRKTK
jgi:copper chaperone CopZ